MNTKTMRILSVLAGVSVLVLLLVGDLLAVLSDKDTGAVAFEYTADDVSISLSVEAGSTATPSSGTPSSGTPSSGTSSTTGDNGENGGSEEVEIVPVEPGQAFELQVSVTSTGEKDSYLLLEFDVPVVSATASGEDENVDLFTLTLDESHWFPVRNDISDNVHTYVYGYGAVPGQLNTFYSGDEVSGVVENATFHDFSNAFEWSGRMEIKAYAIQTVGYETSTPSAVWSSVVSLNP